MRIWRSSDDRLQRLNPKRKRLIARSRRAVFPGAKPKRAGPKAGSQENQDFSNDPVSGPRLMTNWSAMVDGKPVMTIPKAMVLRVFMLNHWIHHRGQLG